MELVLVVGLIGLYLMTYLRYIRRWHMVWILLAVMLWCSIGVTIGQLLGFSSTGT